MKIRPNNEAAPSGLILLHKQPGTTSFDSLRDIKRVLGTGKAGHTGTLDKFAEGLLLVLTGRALKLSQWFTHCDKQYEGTICFGAETDTLDPEGAVIANAPLPGREAVEQALSQFCGKIEQAPPAYSAIHVDGERASALARRGQTPAMRKRPVEIYRLKLLSWEPPHAKIFVHCSGGTYIRSLARDIALTAGSRAHLTALLRTQVAGFKLEDAVSVGRIFNHGEHGGHGGNREEGIGSGEIRNEELGIRPINKAVFKNLDIPCFDITPPDAAKIIQGKPLAQILKDGSPEFGGENAVAALFSGDTFVAVIEKSNDKWKYGYVYARD
ncbi:MAG: tRNA pseudouridine(55) synthase TruB [Treponema sp.]|nr:tRNA pseudouridine(55) synthase TruB [Treponema sp.]